jgi:hypothetical protein
VLHLAKAMLTVRYLRQGQGALTDTQDLLGLKRSIYSALERAQTLFGRGLTVSPSGIRSAYLLNTARLLMAILKTNQDIFVDPTLPIEAAPEIIHGSCEDLQRELGYLREDLLPSDRSAFIEKLFHQQFIIHDDSISLSAYRPTVYYCSAVALWDFLPVRTVGLAKRCLQLLSDCIDMARAVAKANLCIYSFTRTYGEMMPAEEFIGHMQKAIDMIQETAGENLLKTEDSTVISPSPGSSSLLLTLNF